MNNASTKYVPADLFCGIDGGGTVTKVVACTLSGEVVYTFATGTINHYGAGIDKARESFHKIAASLQDKLGCLPGHIFVGNSALSNKISHSTVQDLTAGVFGNATANFHSDVYAALIGFTLGRPGAVLVSGTGSMACGLDAEGQYHTVGGWGQVLGDEGSGYHIAQEGLRAALHAYDGMSRKTQLTERLLRHFELNEVSEIIQKIYYPPAEKSVIAAFAKEVEQAAGEGDTVALEILEKETEWLQKIALAICKVCKTKVLGFYGSVLNHNEGILEKLRSYLQKDDITLSAPILSPELGAILAAFNEAGIPVNQAMINNLKKHKHTI